MADNKLMSVDELNALLGSQKQQAAPTGRAAPVSQEELSKLTQKPAAPTVGLGEDIARSTAAGFGTGAIGLAGLPGDLRNLVELGLQKTGMGSLGQRYVPTSEEVLAKAKEVMPSLAPHLDYEPQYDVSRYAKTAGEFLPGAVIPGGGLGLGARAAGSIGAGLATQGMEDYLSKTPLAGTGYETALKLAAGIPGFSAGTKTLSTAQNLAGGTLRPGSEALRRGSQAMGEDIARGGAYGVKMTPEEIAQTGAKVPAAATAGKSTQDLLASSAQRAKPEAVGAYEAAIGPIQKEAPSRLKEYVNNLLGAPDETTPFQQMAEARRAARSINDENYQKLFALPHAQSIMNEQLGSVVNSLPTGMLGDIAESFRLRRIDPQSMGMVQTKGGWQINPQGMPLKFWDEVKQAVDRERSSFLDPMTGRIKPGFEAKDSWLKDTNTLLKNNLDTAVKEYPAVRGAGAEALGAIDAIDLGTRYLQVKKVEQLENIERSLKRMSPAQKEDFAYGVMGSYKQMMDLDPKAAMNLFSGSKGGDRIRRLNETLRPFGDNVGYEMVGRANAELLNSQLKSLQTGGGTVGKLLPYAPGLIGAGFELGEMILQPALWSNNPKAFALAISSIGLGKMYNMKEARVASKVLEMMADPKRHAELGKLAAQDAAARSFIGKTQNYLGRAVAPGVVSDAQRQGEEETPNQITVNPRPGRASGGRIEGMKTAEMLMRAAHNAKNKISKVSEQILDQPDESVVKALSIAKQHI